MRFMMLMIPRVYQGKNGQGVGADFVPGADDVAKMTKYNEDLAKAGVLVGLDGLHPPASGTRISFQGGKPNVANVLSTDPRNVVGGYWMIDVKSPEEAIGWARRVPAQDGDIIEVRQVFEMSEFPADTQKAAKSATVMTAVERNRPQTKARTAR